MKLSKWPHLAVVILSLSGWSAASAAAQDSYYSAPASVTFHSRLLPKWSFDVAYKRVQPAKSMWVDAVITTPQIDTVAFSASRQISRSSQQRLIASIIASENDDAWRDDIRYINTNAGVAASLGWQFGDPQSLNMAIEYQYRDVGQVDFNTLNLGVHYYF